MILTTLHQYITSHLRNSFLICAYYMYLTSRYGIGNLIYREDTGLLEVKWPFQAHTSPGAGPLTLQTPFSLPSMLRCQGVCTSAGQGSTLFGDKPCPGALPVYSAGRSACKNQQISLPELLCMPKPSFP